MGASTELLLPWPELSDLADGPAAIQALALAADAKMTRLRRVDSGWFAPDSADEGHPVAAGATYTVYTGVAMPLVAIGWADIETNILILSAIPASDPNFAFAGYIQLSVNGTMVQSKRWHNKSRDKTVFAEIHQPVFLLASGTALQIQLQVLVDSGSAPIRASDYYFQVRQFGALRG